MEVILKYFPLLTEEQCRQMDALKELYEDWNAKINLISRKDIDALYLHHVLHSMVIAKYITFRAGTTVMDLGTGGGFPGIPLAILMPESQFYLVDSIKKKINVVSDVAEQIGLKNTFPIWGRADEQKMNYDFIVTRAVARLDQLVSWTLHKLKKESKNSIPNGLIALKGPTCKEEIKELGKKEYSEYHKLSNWLNEPYFEEKYLVYVQGRY